MSHTPKKGKGITDYEYLQIAKREIEDLLNASKWKNRLTFSVKDIREMTGRPKSTLGDLIRSGEIRAMRQGRAWLIPREAIIEWWVDMALKRRKLQKRRKETWIDEPDQSGLTRIMNRA